MLELGQKSNFTAQKLSKVINNSDIESYLLKAIKL